MLDKDKNGDVIYVPDLLSSIKVLKDFCRKDITDNPAKIFTGIWHVDDCLYATDTHFLGCMRIDKKSEEPVYIKVNNKVPDNICKEMESAKPVNFMRVIPKEKEIKDSLVFKSDELTKRGGLIDNWQKAFAYLSTIGSAYNSVIIAKIGTELYAYCTGEDSSKPSVKILLAKNQFVSSDYYRWHINLHAGYLSIIMKAIMSIKAVKLRISYTARTRSMLIEAGAFTGVITPIINNDPISRIFRFFKEESNYNENEFDEKGEYIGPQEKEDLSFLN